mmetsp:Transcript_24955/g.28562  ORF Transcript_24955/g.28562 Transcript_24955/m.28562 type:complete len:99 (+) Transcript_24955:98-394(+)
MQPNDGGNNKENGCPFSRSKKSDEKSTQKNSTIYSNYLLSTHERSYRSSKDEINNMNNLIFSCIDPIVQVDKSGKIVLAMRHVAQYSNTMKMNSLEKI